MDFLRFGKLLTFLKERVIMNAFIRLFIEGSLDLFISAFIRTYNVSEESLKYLDEVRLIDE